MANTDGPMVTGQEARDETPDLMARLLDSLRQKKAELDARDDVTRPMRAAHWAPAQDGEH